MPTIRVNTSIMDGYVSEMETILKSIDSIKSDFDFASSNIDWEIKAESSINYKLNRISRELGEQRNGVSGMKNYMAHAISKYDQVEFKNTINPFVEDLSQVWNSIVSHLPDIDICKYLFQNNKNVANAVMAVSTSGLSLGFWNILSSFLSEEFSKKKEFSLFSGSAEGWLGKLEGSVLSGQIEESSKPKYGTYKDKLYSEEEWREIYKREINGDSEWYSEKATLYELGVEKRVEGSVLSGKYSKEFGSAEFEGGAKFLTAEAHANMGAGLYVLDNKKNKVFSPQVKAEIGGSFAAIQLEANGKIDFLKEHTGIKDLLGAYAKAKVEAISGEAKAGFDLSFKGVRAGVGAEYNKFKATGSVGATVLGTDVGVAGSFKVGVGAHADIGMVDGKFKAGVGVAVGFGLDVELEVDMKKTIDAVCEFATDAWSSIFG